MPAHQATGGGAKDAFDAARAAMAALEEDEVETALRRAANALATGDEGCASAWTQAHRCLAAAETCARTIMLSNILNQVRRGGGRAHRRDVAGNNLP